MTSTLIFLAALMGLVVWWLLRQTVNTKPWIADGQSGSTEEFAWRFRISQPPIKVSLGVFLAVVTSLFALFMSAYFQRMELPDWRAVPEPGILWFNTAVLVLTSIAMQWTHHSAQRNQWDNLKKGILAAGALTVLFLVCQLIAWKQLMASGFYLTNNPANSFFYLFTALHGLHLLGGMVAWVRAVYKIWRNEKTASICLSVELCAVYWHYLLILWLGIFALLLAT